MTFTSFSLLLFPALMAFAAASDLLTMTISNRVSLALIAGFFALALITGMNVNVMGLHVAAAILVLSVTFTFFAFGWIGGGDAKLAAATALWLGFEHLLDYLLLASIFGGLLTVSILFARTLPLPSVLVGQEWAARLHRANVGVPYGIALAASALIVYPHTFWMRGVGL